MYQGQGSPEVKLGGKCTIGMGNLHGFSAFRIGKSQITFCFEISFFLSKSFVDPHNYNRKNNSVNNTSLVSSQCGFQTLCVAKE